MLNIFRASAGSGKTYRLTANYLELLFENKKQPHRNILAVTFTNKATDEMKSRILLELDKLASNKKSDHLQTLSKKHHLDEQEVREKAKQILIEILHDYSRFAVSTIDRFFQQVIRSFTREIGLQGGYNIELDRTAILTASIDRMMHELNKSEHKQLLLWLTQFSEERIEQGSSWNIQYEIQKLADEIFKEKYATFSNEVYEKLQDKDFIKEYKAELHQIKVNFENRIKELAQKALNIIAKHGLQTTDFKGGSRSAFNKLHKITGGDVEELTKTFISLPYNIDNWYTAKSTTVSTVVAIEDAYNGGLNECLNELVCFHQDNIMQYLSIKYITQNIYTLGILSDIDKQVKAYLEEKNQMLLSDSNSLLNKIIDNNDTPFIYEKTGVYIDHYMIDEFQDTSFMQWSNFFPLVKNSLSQNKANLIVGDVKQSIYRWRNSDWKLLDEQLEIDFRDDEIYQEVLDTNWRSCKNIVDFNNAFFTLSSSILQAELNNDIPPQVKEETVSNKISNAYKKLYQKLSPNAKKTEGHVKIEFITRTERNWKEKVLEKLPPVLEELQKNNFLLKDIAILVRTKEEGKMVANYLLEYKKQHADSIYGYDIISDEALLISNSSSVKFILSLLAYFLNADDDINTSIVAYEYLTNIKQLPTEEAIQHYFSTQQKDDISLLNNIFDEETTEKLEQIKHLSLFEMIEEIIRLFNLGKKSNDNIFLQAFQDIVFDFISNNNADIDNFIKWWNNTGYNKSISTPEGQNAIRIMTIHKSKGLDFEAVLLPFCDWALDQKPGSILWCEPNEEPFNQLSIIPIPYTSKLKNTIFYEDYITEKMHSYIDNLNIAYVAFTRAKKELIAFAPQPAENSTKSVAALMYFCFENASAFSTTSDDGYALINLNDKWNGGEFVFQSGSYTTLGPESQSEVKDKEEIKLESYISEESSKQLKLRLHSTNYFSEKEKKVNYGNVMHEILNKITLYSDMNNAIADTIRSGMLDKSEADEVKSKISAFLDIPIVNEWFSTAYKILNEADIITPRSDIYRPDRVLIKGKDAIVIDYKFGEREEKKYHKQVRNYMQLINNMGYQTQGYICYVELHKIEEVE